MILLYQFALLLASPLLCAWILLRRLSGKMPGLRQRLGFFPPLSLAMDQPRLWIHAVSLGEMRVAATLAAELRSRVPGLAVVFTTATATGRQEALRVAAAADAVLYPPIDLAWVCRRFLSRLRPDAVVVVETELWPNLFHTVHRRGTPLLLANARISDRSWPSYRRASWFWRDVLRHLDKIFPSGEPDRVRLIQLGADSSRMPPAGNLKFRAATPARTSAFVSAALRQLQTSAGTKVLVAGSTMAGEESELLTCYRSLLSSNPALWLILAPRHPERFGEVAELLAASGIPFARRSQWTEGQPIATRGVLLLDTIGELAAAYELCNVAFVGGSLVPSGGHNIIEAAAFGKPVVVGPHMENFQEILDLFLAENVGVNIAPARVGSVVQISSAAALPFALGYLLKHPHESRLLGEAARRVYMNNQDRTNGVIQSIAEVLLRTRTSKRSAMGSNIA